MHQLALIASWLSHTQDNILTTFLFILYVLSPARRERTGPPASLETLGFTYENYLILQSLHYLTFLWCVIH